MFQRSENGFGQAGLTLTLNSAYALPEHRAGLRGRIDQIFEYVAALDLVPDLGADVGSISWFSGLLTCTVLCIAPISLFPTMRPLPVSVPSPSDGNAWEETRAQTIAPQAWGSDTGKRMAATDAVVALANAPERPTLDLTASLGQGDGFARVLERAGVGEGEARRVSGLVASATDLGAIKPGTQIKLTLGRRADRNAGRVARRVGHRRRNRGGT